MVRDGERKRQLSHSPIKGYWGVSAPVRRHNRGRGSAFDGSEGVDSEDILGIPQIDFATFQFFPDQIQYEPDNPSLPRFNNTVRAGLEWIKQQELTAKRYEIQELRKPDLEANLS